MQNHHSDSDEELCVILRDLRAELQGKVDLGILTQVDHVIAVLEASSYHENQFKLVILMLGAVFEHLPSIVEAIEKLFRQ